MEKKGTIYGILNLENFKIYIGQSKSYRSRKWNHTSNLRTGRHKNTHLQNAWNKYGADKFIFVILENDISIEELTKRELYWIDKKGSLNREKGYNLAIPNIDCVHKHSEESKEKVRISQYIKYNGEIVNEKEYKEWKYSRRTQRVKRGEVIDKNFLAIIVLELATGNVLGEYKTTGEVAKELNLIKTQGEKGERKARNAIQKVLSPTNPNRSYKGYVFVRKSNYDSKKDYSKNSFKHIPKNVTRITI